MPRKLYFIESIYTSNDPENQDVDVVWIPAEGIGVNYPEYTTFRRRQFMISEPGDIQEGQYVYYNDDPAADGPLFSDGTYSLYAQREIGLSIYYRAELLQRAARFGSEWIQADNQLTFDDAKVYSYHVNVGHGNCSLILIIKGGSYHLWMVDCSLLEVPNKKVLQFTNHEQSFEKALSDMAAKLGKNSHKELFIDHFFLTHMHYDHYNGLKHLISHQHVTSRTLFYMNLHYQMPSRNLNEILEMLVNNNMCRIVEPVSSNGSSAISILHPECRIYKSPSTMLEYADNHRFVSSPNNSSAVFALKLGGGTMVFPGDLEIEGFESMTKTNICCREWNQVDYYAVSHHGSYNGHPQIQCKSRTKRRPLLLCLRNRLSISIIMARDGAYNGIIDERVMHTYDTISKEGAWQTDPSAYDFSFNYLIIDWEKVKVDEI